MRLKPDPNPWKIAVAVLTTVAWTTLFAHPAGAASGGLVAGGGTTAQGTPAAGRYTRLWQERVTSAERRWAHRTSECESGGDPKALGAGGLYRGAFQFTMNAWKTAPKSPGGDPVAY